MKGFQRYSINQRQLTALNPRNSLVFFACFGIVFLLSFVYFLDDSTSYRTLENPEKSTYSSKTSGSNVDRKGRLKNVFKTDIHKNTVKMETIEYVDKETIDNEIPGESSNKKTSKQTTTTTTKATTTKATTTTTTKATTTTTTTTTTTVATTATTTKKPEKTYSILFYTTFFGDRPWSFVKTDYFPSCECGVQSCKVSYDINTYSNADVVVFHGRDMPNTAELERLNKLRNEGQRWAYFIMENPGNAAPVQPLDKYFNWTISYRLNSDFFFPYHEIKQVKTGISPDINYALGKTKQIAWFVSHCGTGRDRLARKLEEYGMKLEVGGGCSRNFRSQINCGRGANCMNLLKQYKFYFSAENGFCKDYVTEKYYKQGLMGNTIPIVLGAAAYSNPRVGIPGSYINPLDFNSPKEFVEHLKMLDRNDTMFNEYFKWKLDWKQEDDPPGCKKFVCDICKKLHSNDIAKDRPLSAQFAGDCGEPTRKYEEWISKS